MFGQYSPFCMMSALSLPTFRQKDSAQAFNVVYMQSIFPAISIRILPAERRSIAPCGTVPPLSAGRMRRGKPTEKMKGGV